MRGSGSAADIDVAPILETTFPIPFYWLVKQLVRITYAVVHEIHAYGESLWGIPTSTITAWRAGHAHQKMCGIPVLRRHIARDLQAAASQRLQQMKQ
jgi:hypothetical protein